MNYAEGGVMLEHNLHTFAKIRLGLRVQVQTRSVHERQAVPMKPEGNGILAFVEFVLYVFSIFHFETCLRSQGKYLPLTILYADLDLHTLLDSFMLGHY